ncbi:calcium uniporter protein, mitochondrial-like [Argopecten irradians]|uniref:calcium uniporter protein, mitochondrial-like n=1 Tax=Argopecten irradians TaxID=31199 RepID=UPI0037154139
MAAPRLSMVVRRGLFQCLPSSRISQVPTRHQIPAILCPCSFHSSSVLLSRGEANVIYRDGLPVFSVPLPSRKETCEFTLKPVSQTVGDFLKYIKEEDGGVDRAIILSDEGKRISQSTTIDVLMRQNFQISINDEVHQFSPPDYKALPSEHVAELSDMKSLISDLYCRLHIDQYQIEQEKQLIQQLEGLKSELAPLEKIRKDLEVKASRRTVNLAWVGLGLMGVQFGVLARLTWWDYSWDIMEPVTYFITYGTTIAMYAYFVITKEEYNFPEVKDRQYLLGFYRNAKKQKLDVQRYNEIKDAIAEVQHDIQRLRDPLQKRLPMKEL